MFFKEGEVAARKASRAFLKLFSANSLQGDFGVALLVVGTAAVQQSPFLDAHLVHLAHICRHELENKFTAQSEGKNSIQYNLMRLLSALVQKLRKR